MGSVERVVVHSACRATLVRVAGSEAVLEAVRLALAVSRVVAAVPGATSGAPRVAQEAEAVAATLESPCR